MKILLISPTQSGVGGIAQHVKGLTKFMQKNGHHIEIMSSENTFTIPVKGLKNPSFMISSFLKSKFKKNFDIVHAHNIPSALAMKNISGKKILTIHGIFSEQIGRIHGNSTGEFSAKYERDAISWADAITVVSEESRKHYSTMNSKIQRIPNGINMSSLTQNENRKFDRQIIFAGRLSKEKGIKSLIEICKNIPSEYHVVIVGDGPEKDAIIKLESEKKNVHYLGLKSHEDTISLIKGSDILIQPSQSEGISTTILEAMACKTIVVVSDVGGNPELIQNGKSGFLINPTDFQSYIEKIIEIFENTSLRGEIQQSSFEHVKKYDWNEIGKMYLDLYLSIIEKN